MITLHYTGRESREGVGGSSTTEDSCIDFLRPVSYKRNINKGLIV